MKIGAVDVNNNRPKREGGRLRTLPNGDVSSIFFLISVSQWKRVYIEWMHNDDCNQTIMPSQTISSFKTTMCLLKL